MISVLIALYLLISACGMDAETERDADFAVLAQNAGAYAQARPGQTLEFPRDHGPHPAYRIEWWYLTANLNDQAGQAYGIQWTLFRLAIQAPGMHVYNNAWQSDQVYMAHFAISTAGQHFPFQRYSRGSNDNTLTRAGVTATPFSARLDDWVLESTGSDWLPMEVRARQDQYALRLDLQSDGPIVLQGEAGFSQKHAEGGGSFYYSQPYLQASGELTINGQTIPVSGEAWLDREWGSQFLKQDQTGWDWFSLHLENGEKLMLFQLRQKPATQPDDNYMYGSLMSPDGSVKALNSDQIQLEVLEKATVADRNLPMRWRVTLPTIGRQFEIEALHPQQWMDVDFPYWEGVVNVHGVGPENRGRGYMELTGYPTGTGTRP